MFSRSVGINNRFDQRVGSQAVAAMKTGAGTFAYGIQAVDGRTGIQVYLDTATQIMCRRSNRNIILGNIDTQTQALFINIGEMLLRLFRIFMVPASASYFICNLSTFSLPH